LLKKGELWINFCFG